MTNSRDEYTTHFTHQQERPAPLRRTDLPKSIADVVTERFRQVEEKGWSAAHDDKYLGFEMTLAASAYALNVALPPEKNLHPIPWAFPWADEFWKPTSPRRDLVKAAALILAEIDRLDRAEAARG